MKITDCFIKSHVAFRYYTKIGQEPKNTELARKRFDKEKNIDLVAFAKVIYECFDEQMNEVNKEIKLKKEILKKLKK